MKRLTVHPVLASWLLLLYFDWLMRFGGFAAVREAVRKQETKCAPKRRDRDRELAHAADLACVFYFKRVLCLQRSAALVVLLRHHGYQAEMIIGAQLLPFLSHAWVEVDGRVINDKPYITQIFQALDRC